MTCFGVIKTIFIQGSTRGLEGPGAPKHLWHVSEDGLLNEPTGPKSSRGAEVVA